MLSRDDRGDRVRAFASNSEIIGGPADRTHHAKTDDRPYLLFKG
jgi:hypothetical protein